MASSIKTGLKKVLKKDKGFIVVQSDMPFIKTSDINKIYNSIKIKKFLVYALKFKNKMGNPIGFDISLAKKFNNIKGEFGARFMVKRLKNKTKFLKTSSVKVFKDFDIASDLDIGKVDPEYLFDVLSKKDLSLSDALFISCTSLPVLSIIKDLEKKLGKIILSSNQTLIWDTLKQIKYKNKVEGYGELFDN